MRPSQAVADHVSESIEHAKPHLRGWLHLGILPLTLAGGILLVAMSPDARTKAGSAVFVGSALLLFGVSAAYHCRNWSHRTWFVLRRLDHCPGMLDSRLAVHADGYPVLSRTSSPPP